MTSFAIIGTGWLPVPVHLSLDECLRVAKPDFVVTAAPWPVTPSLITELVERGVPVLAETPPAHDHALGRLS